MDNGGCDHSNGECTNNNEYYHTCSIIKIL